MPAGADDTGAGDQLQIPVTFDTDNEFMARLFGNDTEAATRWIEDIMLAVAGVYEPLPAANRPSGAGIRLQIGLVILHMDPDPYSTTVTDDSSGILHELVSYWDENYSAGPPCGANLETPCTLPSAAIMLLSGKLSSWYTSGGIAYIGGLCKTPWTYRRVGYRYGATLIGSGVRTYFHRHAKVVAHEFGHLLGSEHTHCYDDPLDHCYNRQSYCYDGPVSCPADDDDGDEGTVMSYCDADASARCGVDLELHPVVAETVRTFTESTVYEYPGCAPTLAAPAADIDGDGIAHAVTDGRLLIRWLFGLRGARGGWRRCRHRTVRNTGRGRHRRLPVRRSTQGGLRPQRRRTHGRSDRRDCVYPTYRMRSKGTAHGRR